MVRISKNEVTGSKPSVLEYAFIRVIDNALLVFIFIMTFLFAGVGIYVKQANLGLHEWFFDAAKLTLGVMLGVLTKEKKRT